MITLGNHTWRKKEVIPYLAETDRVIRPANLSKHTPGRGLTFADSSNGTTVAVVNLLGQLYLSPPQGPWEGVDELVAEARRSTPVILVDFHGEATSEKVAMAAYLDGKVTAVLGTHTHVQTNDARVSPAGTAAITDAGMTGPHDSVIGVVTELAVHQMRTGVPIRFRTAARGVPAGGRRGRGRRGRPGSPRRDGSRRTSVMRTTRRATSVRSRASTSHEEAA